MTQENGLRPGLSTQWSLLAPSLAHFAEGLTLSVTLCECFAACRSDGDSDGDKRQGEGEGKSACDATAANLEMALGGLSDL